MAVPVLRRRRRTLAKRRWSPTKFGANLNTWWRESGIQESGGNLTGWNSDAASAVTRNLVSVSGTPTVTVNGGENAATFVRTSSQVVYLTSTTYTSLTAGVIWAVWKQSTNIVNVQDLLSFGSTGSGNTFLVFRLEAIANQLYPFINVGRATSNSQSARLNSAAEEANNATWRQVPVSTVCVLAIEMDSVNNTVRTFFANSTTMRTFSTFIADADDNSGLQMAEGHAGDGERGNFVSYANTTNTLNRIAIGATAGNASGTTAPSTNFFDGSIFEIGIKSGTLGSDETNFLSYLMTRRALKS